MPGRGRVELPASGAAGRRTPADTVRPRRWPDPRRRSAAGGGSPPVRRPRPGCPAVRTPSATAEPPRRPDARCAWRCRSAGRRP